MAKRRERPRYSVDKILGDLQENNSWYEPGEAHAETPRYGGVNVCGYLRDESGWGAAARGYVRALEHIGEPLSYTDVSGMSSNRSQNPLQTSAEGSGVAQDVNLVCVDAGQHYAALGQLGESYFDGRYNIGAWAWELPRFPPHWYDRFAYYDEIWVGTSWISSVLTPISPVPVVRVPPVLVESGAAGDRRRGRSALGLATEDPFVFLFMFDFHSHTARKNPFALVEAFQKAFCPEDNVLLVLKSVNARADEQGHRRLIEAAGERVRVIDGYLTAQEVRDLVTACDCYVSLHRSEGTGLTISDAMSAGRPVIATGWSGNMDFMTVTNSYPVPFDLVDIEQTVGPYRRGETWAQPRVDEAARLMRHVVHHPEEARDKGIRARQDLDAEFSADAVGTLIEQRLDVIRNRAKFGQLKREMRSYLFAYQQLAESVCATVRSQTPEDARVLVVTRGDPALLELGTRAAHHFMEDGEGRYSGYHPADSDEALQHLESRIGRGATHLVVPGPSLWWLEHYTGLRDYLDAHHRRSWSDDRCVIYDLSPHRRGTQSC